MLCCVPKRPADRGLFYDEAPTTPPFVHKIQPELYPEEDVSTPPPILLPCAICTRTFMPQSLEKHAKICERAATKKRKPFDSAKQRIQGTEMAEFQPKQELRRHQDDKSCVAGLSWKKNHDDFLRVIREARGEAINTHKRCNSLTSSGAPTRANEKGTCPTCNRHFGIKAYDRHVAWCKDRVTKVPVTPAINLAKERLEARMRYRAPALKNRRAANREKYSANLIGSQGKTSTPSLVKPRETVSMPNCNRESPVKQKPAIVRRPGQLKESPISSGPMKSRLVDRTNKPTEDQESLPMTAYRLSQFVVSSHRPSHFAVPPLKPRINASVSSNEIVPHISPNRELSNESETISHYVRTDEVKNRETRSNCSARIQKNLVSTKSQGKPKLNDIAVNDETLGVTVQPYRIHKDPQKDDRLVTWKQISHKKNSLQLTVENNSLVNNFSQKFLLELDQRPAEKKKIDMSEKNEKIQTENSFIMRDGPNDEFKVSEFEKMNIDDITWLNGIQDLNQTYLIKDSNDIEHPESDTAQNLFDSSEHIKPLTVANFITSDIPKRCEESPLGEFHIDFADDNDFSSDIKSLCTKKEDMFHFNVTNNLASSSSFIEYQNCNLSFEDKVSKCNCDNTCCSSLKDLKKDAANATCNQADITNSALLSNRSDPADCDLNLEDEMSPRQDNIYRDLLSVKTNSEGLSSFALHQTDNSEEKIIENVENVEVNEENYENVLITHYNDGFEKYSEEPNLKMLQNPSTVADSDSSLYVNTILSIDTGQLEKGHFDSGNSKNNDNQKTILNADIESNSKTEIPVYLTDVIREICNDGSAKELRCCCCEKTCLCHVSSATRRSSVKEHRTNPVEIKRKIKKSMNLLRCSTDSLVSSVEFVELPSIQQQPGNRVYKKETIEIIRPSRRNRLSKMLPDVPDESAVTRKCCEKSIRQTYWERASKISRSRLISLDRGCQVGYKFAKRNSKIHILPPVPSSPLISGSGTCKDYDPFLLAEQQMKDLLSDTSDQSTMGSPKTQTHNNLYPLSHSSAFVKYPYHTSPVNLDKRSSLIAPPSEFDDLASDFSSDSTETNSISREIFLKDLGDIKNKDMTDHQLNLKPARELGRRLIIDKTKALGGSLIEERRGIIGSADRPRKKLDRFVSKDAPKVIRPLVDRSNSIRASSAPRTNTDSDRKISSDVRNATAKLVESRRSSDQSLNQRNNNYSSLSGSNLSLNSIVSSEIDIKRSNSVFDELMTSFEEDAFPNLSSFLNNESFDVSSSVSVHSDRQRNGVVSDEELSSPDSYKQHNHSKLSNDSAYSSLNRKYSHHGRSTNDVIGRLDETPTNGTPSQMIKCKMSKFCHECGLRFPENAKFCCECGVKRLAL